MNKELTKKYIDELNIFDKLEIYMDYFINETIRNKDFFIEDGKRILMYKTGYKISCYGKHFHKAKYLGYLDICKGWFSSPKALMTFKEFINPKLNFYVRDNNITREFIREPKEIVLMSGIYKWVFLNKEKYEYIWNKKN